MIVRPSKPRRRATKIVATIGPATRVFGVIGWWQSGAGRAERLCALVIAVSAIGRWLPEPANPQAIAWLLTGVGLALPVLLVRTRQHQ